MLIQDRLARGTCRKLPSFIWPVVWSTGSRRENSSSRRWWNRVGSSVHCQNMAWNTCAEGNFSLIFLQRWAQSWRICNGIRTNSPSSRRRAGRKCKWFWGTSPVEIQKRTRNWLSRSILACQGCSLMIGTEKIQTSMHGQERRSINDQSINWSIAC